MPAWWTDIYRIHLLLLDRGGLGTTKVLLDIGGLAELPNNVLANAPSGSDTLGHPGVGSQSITTELKTLQRIANKDALSKPGTEEDGVAAEEDPRVLEDQAVEEDASPQEELQVGDQMHRGIIVLLDESRNGLGQRRSGARSNNGNEVGAEVSQEMEGAVDGEGEERKVHGLAVQPDESHH